MSECYRTECKTKNPVHRHRDNKELYCWNCARIINEHNSPPLFNVSSPSGFTYRYRNPGHWDVCNSGGRIFCIRGKPGNTYIRDERKTHGTRDRDPSGLMFEDAFQAAEWIVKELMNEVREII